MITLDVYKNKRSVKPCAHLHCLADLYNWLDYHREVEVNCAKIKETGDKSYKDNLPAIMPMGTVGDKTRKKENCTPTGLVMIDIDHVEDPKEAWSQMCGGDATYSNLERLGIRIIHITPSGKGLRIILPCMPEGMEATIEKVRLELGLSNFGDVDPACKDLSRLSFLVPEEYIVYTNHLFDDVPQESIEAMKKYQSTGTFEKTSNVQTKFGEVEENDAKYKDYEYNGFRVADIVHDYIESTGGEPTEGTRHTFYNDLIVLFRNLVNNDPKILHAVLPTFNRTTEETWPQCVSLCGNNRTTKLDSRLYFWLRNRNMLEQRVPVEAPQAEAAEESLPPIPELPPIFRQYVNAAPEDFKIPTIFALCPILGTLTSHLRATYFDDSEQSTEFISLLFAPPSSGKSFIKRLSVLLKNLRDRDELANAREELYATKERTKGANDKGEEAPKVSVRIVKPLISIPELLTKMRNNQGHHMYIEAEELDTFTKGNKTAGGDKSDLWRVTWDNGYYGQYYKSVNTFKGEVQMFMNLLFTSTQDQIDRFFKNVEDGLVTRFSVCPIKNQTFSKFQPWKKIPKKEQLQIDNILNRLEMKNYKLPLKFDKSELIDIKSDDFDKIVPWQFEFQPFEHIDLSYIFKPLLDWLEEERIKSAETLNEARDVFRRRAAVKGFRLAMVCHALYNMVGVKEQKLITNFVRWFCTVDLHNSLFQFGQRYNELQQESKRTGIPHSPIFDKMAKEFSKTDLRIALQRAFIKTPTRNVVSLWMRNKLIQKIGPDKYKKL